MELFVFLEKHRAQLEVLYFAVGPLMLVGVIVAWLQLILLRKDLKAKYRRDSIKEVFRSLERFTNIMDMSLALEESLEEDGLWKKSPKIEGFHFSDFPRDCDWVRRFLDSKSCNISIDLLNDVELLSQRILSGIADERYAYKIQGNFFINLVDKHRAEIAAHRTTGQEENYKDTVELYEIWMHRRKRKEVFAKLQAEIKGFLLMPRDKGKKIIS